MKNVPVLAHIGFHSSTSLNPSTFPHVCIGTIKMKDNATLAAKKIWENKSSLHMFSHPLTKKGLSDSVHTSQMLVLCDWTKKEHRPRWNKLNLQRVKSSSAVQCAQRTQGQNNKKNLAFVYSTVFSSRQSVRLYLNTLAIELAEKTSLDTHVVAFAASHVCKNNKAAQKHRVVCVDTETARAN